jgi:hypothetical protein
VTTLPAGNSTSISQVLSAAGSYSINTIATIAGATGSPATQAVAVTGNYNGIADLSLTPATAAYWGLRCYSKTYSGKVADIYNQRTGTPTLELTIGCDGSGNLNAYAGSAQPFSWIASNCTGTSTTCNVGQIYDQTGNGFNLASTAAGRLQLQLADGATTCGAGSSFLPTGKMCFVGDGATYYLSVASLTIASQPFSWEISAIRSTANSTTQMAVAASQTGSTYMGFRNATNTMTASAGTTVFHTANDGVWHAAQAVFSTTVASFNVDAGTPVTTTTGANIVGGAFYIGQDSGGHKLLGAGQEVGLWSDAFGASDPGAINTNVHSSYGLGL